MLFRVLPCGIVLVLSGFAVRVQCKRRQSSAFALIELKRIIPPKKAARPRSFTMKQASL
jgi:hypothetical protein